jgi:CelD/BcsL family acetyltransferase involved in cellulose biosynthesis
VITVLPGRELSQNLADKWRALQASNADLAAPYFCPEFTSAVASVRDDVHFAVMENHGKIAAFFPYQSQGRCGQPVGGPVSDFQGVVCGPNFEVDVLRLLKACKLHAFDFDHMLTLQPGFALHAYGLEVSPRIDISQGYAAYVAERRKAGSQQIKKCGNLMRRIEREVGPLSFVPHSGDAGLLGKVLAWKSAQYVRTGQCDLFAVPWVRSLVERIHATDARNFAGRLSLLYAGDRLVAGHFGMRTPLVWHYWFPAYDMRFANYSPGLLLLLKIVEHAATLGTRHIDLGKGLSLYKERLMNARTVLSYGSVEAPSLLKFKRTIGRYVWTLARNTILNSPIEGPARRLVQAHRAAHRDVKN